MINTRRLRPEPAYLAQGRQSGQPSASVSGGGLAGAAGKQHQEGARRRGRRRGEPDRVRAHRSPWNGRSGSSLPHRLPHAAKTGEQTHQEVISAMNAFQAPLCMKSQPGLECLIIEGLIARKSAGEALRNCDGQHAPVCGCGGIPACPSCNVCLDSCFLIRILKAH